MKKQTLPKEIGDFFTSQPYKFHIQQAKESDNFQKLVKSDAYLYYILDFQTGKFSFVSEGLKSALGYDKSIWDRGVDALWQMVHPDDINDFCEVLIRWIDFLNSFQDEELLNQYSVSSNCRFLHKDGRTVPVILKSTYTSLDNLGNLVYNLCKVELVSEREAEPRVTLQIFDPKDVKLFKRQSRNNMPTDPLFKVNKIQKISLTNKFIARVRLIIQQHLDDEHFGVQKLSDHLNLSRTQVYRKIYSLIEESPNELIRLIRLVEAAKMLEENDRNVTEITYLVGFSNPAYFIKCFKKIYGITPKQYQNAYRDQVG